MNDKHREIIPKIIAESFIENPGARAAKELIKLGITREDYREFASKTIEGRLTGSGIHIKIENAFCDLEKGL